MDNDESSNVRDRISARFEDENSDSERPGTEGNTRDSNDAGNDEISSSSSASMNAMKSQNVKKDWNATTIYLPDKLDREFSTAYKRADLEVSEVSDRSLKKTRHYYPLIVTLGLEKLESMDSNEVMEELDKLSS